MSNKAKFPKSLVTRDFNKYASSYEKASFLQQEISNRLLERLMYMKISPSYILDLGGGTGKLSKDINTIYPNATVVNLDIAHSMLREDKSNSLKCCADFDIPPFGANQFDLIISNCSLQWSIDLQHTMKQLYAILSTDGVLIFSSFGPDTLFELRKSWNAIDSNIHINEFLDLHIIGDILLQNNFIDPVVDKEVITVKYNDAIQLMYELKNMGASNKNNHKFKGLTTKKILQQVKNKYHELFCDIDGNVTATFEIIYGLCWGKKRKMKEGDVQHIYVDTIKNIS